MSQFDVCLPIILKEEGGNDDDPHDHGGRTSRGITQREYSAWCIKHNLPNGDVWAASDDTIHNIYLNEYWLPRGPKLHPGVDLVWFNFAVNAGPNEAYKLLMRSIGPDDEDDDPHTVNLMCNAGEAFYRGLAQFPRYGKGWVSRTERIRAAALKMQKETPMSGPHDNIPPQKSKVPNVEPPVIDIRKGHVMVDVTQIVKAVNVSLDVAEKLDQFLAMVNPAMANFILSAIKGVRSIETSLGIASKVDDFDPSAANQATNHVTPGAPNSPALGPTAVKL